MVSKSALLDRSNKNSYLRLMCFRRVKTVQKKVVVLVDDRDGSVAKQTISFAFKGVSYEIDLSDQNAEQFERDMSRKGNRTERSLPDSLCHY